MGSGYKTFTAGSVLTASDVNNYLMEQSVMVFATTGARDAAITAPESGMLAYINSGDINEGLYFYDGGSWWRGPSWNSPWGVVPTSSGGTNGVAFNEAMSLTIASGSNSDTAIVGGSFTITTRASRVYRLTVTTSVTAATTGGAGTLAIDDGAGGIRYRYTFPVSSASGETVNINIPFSPLGTSSKVYRLLFRRESGFVGSMTLANCFYSIEDIGPNGGPA